MPSPFPGEGTAQSPVKVRHVVTRTITYSRPAGSAGGRQHLQREKGSSEEGKDQSQDTVKREGQDENEHENENGSEGEGVTKPLVGEAPRGKRRKVE